MQVPTARGVKDDTGAAAKLLGLGEGKVSTFGIVGMCILLPLLSGCAARQKTVTNLPPGVTQQQAQNWDSAVANLDKIAHSTSTFRQLIFSLNGATYVNVSTGQGEKIIPDGATYAGIITAIGRIDQAQLDAASYLKAQPKNWGASTQEKVKNDLVLIQTELSTITTQQLTGIKNPASQKEVQALIAEITSLVNIVLSLTS